MFHILVVEDNDNTRKLMEAVLSQNGYEPIPARDGVRRWRCSTASTSI